MINFVFEIVFTLSRVAVAGEVLLISFLLLAFAHDAGGWLARRFP